MDPAIMRVSENILRADELISAQKAELHDLDVLVMPEMLFSGYVFSDRDEIDPFLEDPSDSLSPSIVFASRKAKELGSYVVIGFPERSGHSAFNSQAVVAPDGQLVQIYRKHFLYETDESWADEGEGFHVSNLPGLGRTGLGICMDLNPRRFEAPFNDFEFANAMLEGDARLILCSMNWLSQGTEDLPHDLVAYWRLRLYPLELQRQPVVVAIANRTGTERGVTFAGCSCVMDLRNGTLAGLLGPREEGLLVCEL